MSATATLDADSNAVVDELPYTFGNQSYTPFTIPGVWEPNVDRIDITGYLERKPDLLLDEIETADAELAMGPQTRKTLFVQGARNTDWAARFAKRNFPDQDPDSVELWHKVRNDQMVEVGDLDEFQAVQWVSTVDVDRDNEIMLPAGANLSEFRQNPRVLWGHDARQLPIGKDLWIKKAPTKDPTGILAKTLYDDDGLGAEVFRLKKKKFLDAHSVGFIPTEYVRRGQDDFDKLLETVVRRYPHLAERADDVDGIIKSWILLEHSDVNVPANASALTVAIGKGQLDMSDEIRSALGMGSRERLVRQCAPSRRAVRVVRACPRTRPRVVVPVKRNRIDVDQLAQDAIGKVLG